MDNDVKLFKAAQILESLDIFDASKLPKFDEAAKNFSGPIPETYSLDNLNERREFIRVQFFLNLLQDSDKDIPISSRIEKAYQAALSELSEDKLDPTNADIFKNRKVSLFKIFRAVLLGFSFLAFMGFYYATYVVRTSIGFDESKLNKGQYLSTFSISFLIYIFIFLIAYLLNRSRMLHTHKLQDPSKNLIRIALVAIFTSTSPIAFYFMKTSSPLFEIEEATLFIAYPMAFFGSLLSAFGTLFGGLLTAAYFYEALSQTVARVTFGFFE